MSIDILNLQPNVISRSLKEKIVMIYGLPKTGKTTMATKFPKPLLLGFEKGYNAISGIRAVPITKWSDYKKIIKQLNTDEAKSMYDTIIIDTIDIAYDLVEQFVIRKAGVEKMGDVAYGALYAEALKEIKETLRQIPAMGYGLVMISHAKEINIGTEDSPMMQIVPTVNARVKKEVAGMADIYGFANIITRDGVPETRLYLRGTTRFEAGSRFPYTPQSILMDYDELNNAIAEAINQQEERGDLVADETNNNIYAKEIVDFETVKREAVVIIGDLMEIFEKVSETPEEKAKNMDKITTIIDNHLGKGKLLKDATKDQADMIELIVGDLKDLQKSFA